MFELQRKIYCSQLGEGGVIRNSGLIDLLQDTSDLHLANHPVLASFFEETGCVMFLTSRQVDIIRRPEYQEVITAKTRTYELNRMYGFRNTILVDEKGEIIVKSIAGGAFMDLKTGRPIRVDKELIEKVKVYDKIDMEYLPRKIALPDAEPVLTADVPIRHSDIDMFGHVNNARYFDLTDELVDNSSTARRLRVEYKTPVKYGDAVTAQVFAEGDKRTVSLSDDQGKRCCTVEYTF
ncbi:MAG: acyl-ACP thioesterase [Ruminococcus sp.]|nr:acyl-ACP thioesterase [Ruminococcus sp.]